MSEYITNAFTGFAIDNCKRLLTFHLDCINITWPSQMGMQSTIDKGNFSVNMKEHRALLLCMDTFVKIISYLYLR